MVTALYLKSPAVMSIACVDVPSYTTCVVLYAALTASADVPNRAR